MLMVGWLTSSSECHGVAMSCEFCCLKKSRSEPNGLPLTPILQTSGSHFPRFLEAGGYKFT